MGVRCWGSGVKYFCWSCGFVSVDQDLGFRGSRVGVGDLMAQGCIEMRGGLQKGSSTEVGGCV